MALQHVRAGGFVAGVARLNELLGVVGAAILIGMLLLVAANVVLRYGFGSPIAWADQVATYGIVYVTFIGAPRVLARRGHVAVDILENTLSPAGRRVLRTGIDTVGFLYCSVFTLLALRETQRLIDRGAQFTDAVTVPQWIVYSVIPLGAALLALQFLAHLLTDLRSLREPGS